MKQYVNLKKCKLMGEKLGPVGLVYPIIRKEHKLTAVKIGVKFNKYGRSDAGREKVLKEITERDGFVCWLTECEQIPFTDEEIKEISEHKEIGFMLLSNIKLRIPVHLRNN